MPTSKSLLLSLAGTLSAILLLLASPEARACSQRSQPNNFAPLSGNIGAVASGIGSDTVAPSQIVLSTPLVTLVQNGCDGSGTACPDLDQIEATLQVSDDKSPAAKLRYVVAFGNTLEEAAAAAFTQKFDAEPEPAMAYQLRASLGYGGQRSGEGFSRQNLCFALAAADEAGNVGPRSQPVCLNTTEVTGSTTKLVQRAGCFDGSGCNAVSSAGGWLSAVCAVALASLCRRRGSRAA